MNDTLGLELEVSNLRVYINKGNIDIDTFEQYIKGRPIDQLYDRKIDVTLDLRSPNNNSQLGDKNISANIEYIFNHTYFPINELNTNDWEWLQLLLKNNISLICNNVYNSIGQHPNKYSFTIDSKRLEQDPILMIHLTCAYPLWNIFDENMRKYIMGSEQEYLEVFIDENKNDKVLNIADYDNHQRLSCLNYIALLWQIFNAAESNCGISPDPKQYINVMNRTALGSIFLHSLDNNSCNFINSFLTKVFRENPIYPICDKITHHITKDITNKDIIDYLIDISSPEDDPLLKTNEKIGISQLGDKFQNNFPIFEFRDCGTLPLSKLKLFLQKISEMLTNREMNIANFRTNIITSS